jgi:Flp pilus assembly protein TadG
MAAPVSRLRVRQRVRQAAAGASRLARRTGEGVSGGFVAALAALVLVGILYTVATREPKEPRGYAEFTMSPGGCTVDPRQQLNVDVCVRVSNGVYRLTFTKSLTGSTVLASRGTCCPGRIGASFESERAVLVAIEPGVRGPIRASVFVP